MAQHYDLIIIGSGPNGLEIGAYLSKAGQKVLLLEKRFEAGGGLCTEQVTLPDFFHNTHAIYHLMADFSPVYQDFQFEEKYGVKHIFPDLQWVMPTANGKSLCLYRDLDKTCASIAQFSQKDAKSYRDMVRLYDDMMKNIIGPMTFIKPEPAPIMAFKAERTPLGAQMTSMSDKTPEEVVNALFENDVVRTLMLYICCHWSLDYDQSGVGYLIPLYLNRSVHYRMVAGGSHRVSNALLKSVFENQGQIRTNAQIKRIIVEKGAAKGGEMEDGTKIMADKGGGSTLDTHQT